MDEPYDDQGSFLGGSYICRAQSPKIESDVCDEWKRILRITMEEKYLYQNTRFEVEVLRQHTNEEFSLENLESEFRKRSTYPLSDGRLEGNTHTLDWYDSGAMDSSIHNYDYEEQVLPFYLPPINIKCDICSDKRTFGSLSGSRSGDGQYLLHSPPNGDKKQVYTFYIGVRIDKAAP